MNFFWLRLKTLFSDKISMICYALSVAVIVAILFGLNMHAGERSSLPIGLIDNDKSAMSSKLFERISDNSAVYVYEGSFDELYELMTDGYVNCIFVIDEGYSDKVLKGMSARLITVYAAEDNKISTVLQDVVAGAMMDDICLSKAYIAYSKADGVDKDNMFTYADYSDYVDKERLDESYAFSFDLSFEDGVNISKTSADINNSMMYQQMIALMLAMLIMIVVFSAYNVSMQEKEAGITKRLNVSQMSKALIYLEENLAATVFSLPLLILVSFLFGTEKFFMLLAVNLVFTVFVSLVFSALVRITPSAFLYRFVGTAVVLILSVMGFVSIFEGLLGIDIFKATPVAYYVQRIVGFGGF